MRPFPALQMRSLGEYNFEGGGFVRIVVGGSVDTEIALDMVSELVARKHKELAKIQAKSD